MWFPVLPLAAVLSVCCGSSLLQEVRDLKICPRSGQCARLKGVRLENPAVMDRISFGSSSCFCDSGCHLFNDCCPDVANPEPSDSILSIPSQYWGCGTQRLANRSYEMQYMVTTCPDGHPLQDLCTQNVPDDEYDYKLDLPVLSSQTGAWFQNIFCAVCHDHFHQLRPLKLTFSCTGINATVNSVLGSGVYIPGTLQWNWTDCSCIISAQIGEDEEHFAVPSDRPCVDVISNCPSNWTNTNITSRCRSYSMFVIMRQGTGTPIINYKNPHCVLCNGVSMDEVKCYLGQFKRNPDKTLPSLRLIMDFSWDVVRESCQPPTGIWDALHARCQSLSGVCSSGMRFKAGKCLSENNNQASIASETDDMTCPHTVLEAKEFILIDNGTLQIIINSSDLFGQLFTPGQYRELTDGRVEICYSFPTTLVFLDAVQGYLTTVCLSISVICLALHLIVHALLPKLHNLPGKNLQALSWALLLAQLGFLLGVTPVVSVPVNVCVAIAVVLHFNYLAAFCWMNVMSIDIWRTFSATTARTVNIVSTHRKYALYAWGVPAVVTFLALVANYTDMLPPAMRPNFATTGTCWFGNRVGLGLFLASPVTTILLVNILLFCNTVYKLHQKQESRRYIKKKVQAELLQASKQTTRVVSQPAITGPRDQIRFYLYVKLFTIMGLSWVTGTVAVLAHQPVLWYPYVVLNGLQGAFIFIMFDVKRNVMVMLWEHFLGQYPLPSVLAARSSSSRNTMETKVSSSSRLSSNATMHISR